MKELLYLVLALIFLTQTFAYASPDGVDYNFEYTHPMYRVLGKYNRGWLYDDLAFEITQRHSNGLCSGYAATQTPPITAHCEIDGVRFMVTACLFNNTPDVESNDVNDSAFLRDAGFILTKFPNGAQLIEDNGRHLTIKVEELRRKKP